MPLKFEMKPFERLIINGASIRFGNRATSVVIETHARFLREREIIKEADANTPAKRILFTLQAVYMMEPSQRHELNGALLRQVADFAKAVPSSHVHIAAIGTFLAEDSHHSAIKQARKLVAYEADLLAAASAA